MSEPGGIEPEKILVRELGPPWCEWRRNKKGAWRVECLGHDWALWDDGPYKNEFIYCPFCGDPLREYDL